MLVALAAAVYARLDPTPNPADVAAACRRITERFDDVPAQLGDWHVSDVESPLADFIVERRDDLFKDALWRTYVNAETGDVADVLVVVGSGREISIHTPDKQYYSVSLSMREQPRAYVIGGEAPVGRCFTAPFTRGPFNGPQERYRIFWTWNGGDGWVASDTPRTARINLLRYPVLTKLYVVTNIPKMPVPFVEDPPSEFSEYFKQAEDNACLDLIEQLLPALNESLRLAELQEMVWY